MVRTTMRIVRPGTMAAEIREIRMAIRPSWYDVANAIEPIIQSYIEYVRIRYDDGDADMFIDRAGRRKMLPINALATMLYREAVNAGWVIAPGRQGTVYGLAVIFSRRVWF